MWFDALDTLRQVLFIIGCSAGGVLVIQIVMMLIGMGIGADFDGDAGSGDFDGGGVGDTINDGGAIGIFGMKLLSFRAIIAFVGIFCWTGFVLCDPELLGTNLKWLGILLSVVAGAGAAVLMAYGLYAIEKLQESGNVSIENTVGKVGDVYLRIPANKVSAGKIQITVQERLREYEAFNAGDTELKQGDKVKVISVIDDTTVLVEKF